MEKNREENIEPIALTTEKVEDNEADSADKEENGVNEDEENIVQDLSKSRTEMNDNKGNSD